MDGGLVTARIRVTVGLAIPTPWRGSRATVGPLPALPLSAGGSGAPATGCAPSHTPPLFFQKVHEGLRVVVGSHLHQGTWAIDGAATGFPPGLASSGLPAGLHPAPGLRAGSDLPAPASCPSALGVVPDEDLRAISLAPQVG